MKHTRILPLTLRSAMQAGLFLIALVTGLGLMPGWELTSGAQSCQQEGACFVFESQGYITDASTGQTTMAFRVTNKCRNLVSYVAIGTAGFTRVAPADRSSYNGDLSPYDVSWTGRGGTPGFESVKFTPTLKKFANSASEVFNVVVSNFSPATMVTVRAKAGNAQETYNFMLNQTCGLPTPTRRIYWTNIALGTDMIGRMNPKTQNINQSFINTNDVGFGVAVDSSHIYWTNTNYETVGRADLDGQNVDQNFIVLTGQSVGLYGLAVDSNYLYWADINNSIGRAELDGQNVNLTFISGCQQPRGVAVDRSHVYWANDGNSIGLADLDGQNVNQHFVPNCPSPFGIAVDPE